MNLTEELLSIGLANKEAEVYLAALQLGYCSVQEIANKAGIQRTTAYTHIKNLVSRGLIQAVEKNGKIFYVAEKPDKLKYIYDQQEREAQRRRTMLEKIMPELESIYNIAKDKPSVRYYSYEDKQELEFVRQEIQELRSEKMYNIFNHELYKEYISRQHIQAILDSVQQFQVLYIGKHEIIDPKVRSFFNHEKFDLKFLPEARFGFLSEILIADRSVYIAGRGDWLIIEDNLFSQTLTLLFQALWGIAK